MPRNNNNFWLASWVVNFDKNHQSPAPPNPCPTIAFNTVAKADYKCNVENAMQLQFANHAWLTILTINLFFVNTSPQISASATALGATAQNITNAIISFIGSSSVTTNIKTALDNHIGLAATYLTVLKTDGTGTTADDAANAFTAQAVELATAFSALDCSLTYDGMYAMWLLHDEAVLNIANLVYSGVQGTTSDFTAAITDAIEYFSENTDMALEIAGGIATHHYR